MARKIAVEGERTNYKKSVAELLIRRLLAVWVIEGISIRRLAVREIPDQAARFTLETKAYIPERMPPREVPNTKFVPPERKPLTFQQATRCLHHG